MPDDLTARARQLAEDYRDNWYIASDGTRQQDEAFLKDADLLTALADRVDEQERRIKELEGELSRAVQFPPHIQTEKDRRDYLQILAKLPSFDELEAIEVKPDATFQAKVAEIQAAEALSQKGGE